MVDQFDSLDSNNLIITLRSLRRRFDGVVGPVRSSPKLFALVDQAGPGAQSFGQVLSEGAHRTAALGARLAKIAPASGTVSLDDFEPTPPEPRLSLSEAQELIATTAETLADALDHLGADRWAEAVTVEQVGGGTSETSVLDLGRETARRAIGTLRKLTTLADAMSPADQAAQDD